jgi:hypothetical protein
MGGWCVWVWVFYRAGKKRGIDGIEGDVEKSGKGAKEKGKEKKHDKNATARPKLSVGTFAKFFRLVKGPFETPSSHQSHPSWRLAPTSPRTSSSRAIHIPAPPLKRPHLLGRHVPKHQVDSGARDGVAHLEAYSEIYVRGFVGRVGPRSEAPGALEPVVCFALMWVLWVFDLGLLVS